MFFTFFEDNDTAFIKNLKTLMYERHLSIADIAKGSGIPYPTVHSWFQGKTPRGTNMAKLCEYLGVSRSELLTAPEQKAEAEPFRAERPGNQSAVTDYVATTPEGSQVFVEMVNSANSRQRREKLALLLKYWNNLDEASQDIILDIAANFARGPKV